MASPMLEFNEKEYLAVCGSSKFAKEMVSVGPFSSYQHAIDAARDIWFNKVDVNGWLEAFAAHPQIGNRSASHNNSTSAQWSKGEQSTALATATDATLEELYEWNARYMQKFGFVFLICASGRSSSEILAELKRHYVNRPIVEFENAAKEQMKITELRFQKLLDSKSAPDSSTELQQTTDVVAKAGEDRVSIIGAHLTTATESPIGKPPQTPTRSRPPITTHVLDIARGCPAPDIEVRLEMWGGHTPKPVFVEGDAGSWICQGRSSTDKDGRSGQLMGMIDALTPGTYRISFNTGKYNPNGFFPYVSIIFEVKDSQQFEHFHVPLLLSPFSFSTYRGS
ncbi:hypothetical protein Leryth_023909 [Lithospermum erythrorhizon]|nr:hypothetical protein Leryth_023909 [Lithospermum erythrorhizon]